MVNINLSALETCLSNHETNSVSGVNVVFLLPPKYQTIASFLLHKSVQFLTKENGKKNFSV